MTAAKAKVAASITLTFEHERDTKNASRFREVLTKGQERGTVGTLYVLQTDLEANRIDPALGITVTIAQTASDG